MGRPQNNCWKYQRAGDVVLLHWRFLAMCCRCGRLKLVAQTPAKWQQRLWPRYCLCGVKCLLSEQLNAAHRLDHARKK